MTFFKPKTKTPAHAPIQPVFTPPHVNTRGDRSMPVRMEAPKPVHREASSRAEAVDKLPNGCAFKVKPQSAKREVGYFDLDGYWCIRVAGEVKVTRGAPRKVMALLTDNQRKELERRRLNARRSGLR